MANDKLKDALTNCLVNFDRRVLVTDLTAEYDLEYKEVNEVLMDFIEKQEKLGKKYEKRFLVHGEEDDSKDEIFTIVNGEKDLKTWLSKLKNSESSLYSIEIAGGAKAPARILTPMVKPVILLENCEKPDEQRTKSKVINVDDKEKVMKRPANVQANSITNVFNKNSKTTASSSDNKTGNAKNDASTSNKVTSDDKPSTSSAKKSPTNKSIAEEKKVTPKQTPKSNKRGINSFFTPAKSVKTDDSIDNTKSKVDTKTPTPKKMNDFFKKQTEKPTPIPKEIKQEVKNTSVQLFDEENEFSSDEDEKLNALKREMNFSDDEISTSNNVKRRRIEDSDDEEPQVKHEKKDDAISIDSDSVEVEAPKSETYLDEDGFVMTVKPKKAIVSKTTKKSSVEKKRSPLKQSTASKSKATQPPAKTKQGNIMNFFTKK